MSPDRADTFQTVQVGLETTSGSSVAATIKLATIAIDPGVKATVQTFTPMGSKFAYVAAEQQELTEAKLSGELSYSEIEYLLQSGIGTASGSLMGSGCYQYIHTPNTAAPDAHKTLTVEQGDANFAHKFTYGLVTDLKMSFSRKDCKLEGTMIGQQLQTGITMTSASLVNVVEMTPVMSNQVSVYNATAGSGLAGASAMSRVLSVEWSLSNRYNPIWPLNAANASFAGDIEDQPKGKGKIKLQADADYVTFLNALRAGTTMFLRIKAQGTLIGGAYYYLLQIDQAIKFTDIAPFSDEDGVFATEFGFEFAHDPTWGKSFQITTQNKLSTL